jgi:predicted nuclease with TOPRIM domain
VSGVSDVPPWLQWILPSSAVAAGVLWLARVILLPGIKSQIEEMLKDKFEEAQAAIEKRHQENRRDILRVEQQLNESFAERQKLHDDMMEIKEDVAYLRGRSGNFKRQ